MLKIELVHEIMVITASATRYGSGTSVHMRRRTRAFAGAKHKAGM